MVLFDPNGQKTLEKAGGLGTASNNKTETPLALQGICAFRPCIHKVLIIRGSTIIICSLLMDKLLKDPWVS